jgi:hypothetical protein
MVPAIFVCIWFEYTLKTTNHSALKKQIQLHPKNNQPLGLKDKYSDSGQIITLSCR